VSLPAQANVAALKTAPSLTPSQLKQLLAQAPDLTPPASQPTGWTPGAGADAPGPRPDDGRRNDEADDLRLPDHAGPACARLDRFRDRFADVDFTYGHGIVWGLVPNSVTAVDVHVSGAKRPARLENNVYFFEGDAPQQLVVHFRDGSTKSVAIPAVTMRSGTG
jgi:hypothetical protein